MTTGSHWPLLMDKPLGEDGFYMLTVADNIATSGHIRYNGGLPATGIQALATFAFAAVEWLVRQCGGSSNLLLRAILVLGALLAIVFALQMRQITKHLSPPALENYAATLAFLLTLTSFTLFRLFTYGLETGFYLVAVAAVFQVTISIWRRQRTDTYNVILLGIASGVAGAVRIDFGLVFVALMFMLLLYRWITLGRATTAAFIALALVSPWLWFVHRVSGSWLPTSGKAESTLVASTTVFERFGVMALAVAGECMPWCYAVVSHATVIVSVASAFAVLAWFVSNSDRSHAFKDAMRSRLLQAWLLSLFALVPVYIALFNSTHFYYRYLAPLCVATVPVCAITLAQSEWVRHNMRSVAVALWAGFALWATVALHTGHIGNSQTVAAGYIHQHFAKTRVGAFQSGVIGYFNHNVENLDGKLNQGALQATARHQLPQFIDHEHINVLVDWPSVLYANLPRTYLQREWTACPVPLHSESICLIRRGGTLPQDSVSEQQTP